MDNCQLSFDRAVHRWVCWMFVFVFNGHCICYQKKVITTWCGQSPSFVRTITIAGDISQRKWVVASGKHGIFIHGSKKILNWNNQTKSLYLYKKLRFRSSRKLSRFLPVGMIGAATTVILMGFFYSQQKWTHKKKFGKRLLIATVSTTSPITGESRATNVARNEFWNHL